MTLFLPPHKRRILLRYMRFTLALTLLVLTVVVASDRAEVFAQDEPEETEEPLYECDTDSESGYMIFKADSDLVDQVCPAHVSNFNTDTDAMESTGALYIVIHHTGSPADNRIPDNISVFQTDGEKKVSAQYIVGLSEDRTEVHVIQLVPEDHVAYHAGVRHHLAGVSIGNTNSIGIEVVGRGDLPGWPPDEVYRKVADLVLDIVERAHEDNRTVELTRDYIVGHEEINQTGKWDPAQQWDWQLFMETYLSGTYEPAMSLTASLDPESNEVKLQLTARDFGRTELRVERRQDRGEYAAILRPIKDTGDDHIPNPAVIDFKEVDTLSMPVKPMQYCYRVWGYKKPMNYVNPSTEACVTLGIADAHILEMSPTPTLKPGESATLHLKLQNTGNLDWIREPDYGLRFVEGERLGGTDWKPVDQRVPAATSVDLQLLVVAPQSPGDYTSVWQMAYIDPDTKEAELFGPLIDFNISVRRDGVGGIFDSVVDAIKGIIEGIVQGIEDLVQGLLDAIKTAFLDLIGRALDSLWEELARLLQCTTCMAVPGAIVYKSRAAITRHRRRTER